MTIDGHPWLTSDEGHFAVQVTIGRHRVEVTQQRFRSFSTDVDVREGETMPLNVSLRAACTKAGSPGRIPHDLRRSAVRNLVRAGIPECAAMQMTGHKTRSVFERYNIVSECDLVEAAQKLNLLQPVPPASNRDEGLPAEAAKSAHREGGHNSGTIEADRGSRRRTSL